jgi:uncharacterized delta-60 repeat protein
MKNYFIILNILLFLYCLKDLKNPYSLDQPLGMFYFLFLNSSDFNNQNPSNSAGSTTNIGLTGTLDPSFGTNGSTVINFAPNDKARGLLIDNNKIILVGDNGNDFAIVKLLSNGSLDTSFGSGGKKTHDLPIGVPSSSYNDYGIDVVKANDGNYLISGTNSNSPRNVLVVKINSSTGNLLLSFGSSGSGYNSQETISNTEIHNSIKVLSNNKIIVGETRSLGNKDFYLLRYSQDGSGLDAGGNAYCGYDYSSQNNVLIKILLDSSENIIAGGFVTQTTPTNTDIALIKVGNNFNTSNCLLSPTFGTSGWAIYGNSSNDEEMIDMIIDSSNNIYVLGHRDLTEILILKFNSSGNLVSSFGTGGVLSFAMSSLFATGMPTSFILHPNGKFYLAGDNGSNNARIVAINQDGSLDSNFGSNGILDFLPNGCSSSASINKIDIQSNGKLIVMGNCKGSASGNPDFFVSRVY